MGGMGFPILGFPNPGFLILGLPIQGLLIPGFPVWGFPIPIALKRLHRVIIVMNQISNWKWSR